uniref:Uncharacterized protein n=1 Tax=Plectus sambesii TaxID=2011161 RepID=A0A914X2D7_9BILA
MSRNKSKSAGSTGASGGSKSTLGCAESNDVPQALSVNQLGDVVLRIHAKPGAKRSAVLGVTDEVSVAIAAPPRDGEANQELIEFIASVLGLKKGQVSFDAGARSRSKIIVIDSSSKMSKDQVRDKLQNAIGEK